MLRTAGLGLGFAFARFSIGVAGPEGHTVIVPLVTVVVVVLQHNAREISPCW